MEPPALGPGQLETRPGWAGSGSERDLGSGAGGPPGRLHWVETPSWGCSPRGRWEAGGGDGCKCGVCGRSEEGGWQVLN